MFNLLNSQRMVLKSCTEPQVAGFCVISAASFGIAATMTSIHLVNKTSSLMGSSMIMFYTAIVMAVVARMTAVILDNYVVKGEGIAQGKFLRLIGMRLGCVLYAMLIILWAMSLIRPPMIDTLYGISLDKPFTESHVEALSEKGMRVMAREGNVRWDYRLIDPLKPTTEVLVYLDEDKGRVLRVEALIRLESFVDASVKAKVDAGHFPWDYAYRDNLREIRDVYDGLIVSLEDRQKWSWWHDFTIHDFRDFSEENERYWMQAIDDKRPIESRLSNHRESIWTDGTRLLWVYVSGMGDLHVILQDSRALSEMYAGEIEAREANDLAEKESLLQEKEGNLNNKIQRFNAPSVQ